MTDRFSSDLKSAVDGGPARVIPEYARPDLGDPDELVTLVSLPALEAELARAKLGAEGVPSFAANAEIAHVHILGIAVRIQVRRQDVDRAREILDRPPENVADGEYVDEPWRCPKCRRKTLDILPPTPAQRFRRNCWVVLLLLVLAWFCLPLDRVVELRRHFVFLTGLGALILTLLLGVYVFAAERGKRCRECNWSNIGEKKMQH